MATYTFDTDLVFETSVDGTVYGKFDEDKDDVACDEFTGLQLVEVATGVSDQALSLGGLTTAYSVALITDQVVTLKLNGGSETLTLRANEPILLPTITAITVSNSSGSTAHIKYIAAGT